MRSWLQAAGRAVTPWLLAPERRDRAWSRALYLRLYLAAKAVGERQQRAFLRSLVRSGDVVLDVGANVGFYTVLLARWVGPGGHVHAFEPDPWSVDLLRARCRALPQVSVVAAAAGGDAGTAVLHVSGTNRADNRLHAPDTIGERVEVPVVTLDGYCAQAGVARVDVVKIDVQGSEVAALRGFAAGLRRFRPRDLVVELSPEHLRRAGSSAVELLALLRAAGYAPWTCASRRTAAPITDDARFAADWEHDYTDVWARRLPLAE